METKPDTIKISADHKKEISLQSRVADVWQFRKML
jgi:hypothetical protein